VAKGKGYQGILGFKRNTNTWGGAAVAAGATDGVEVVSSPLQANRALVPDMQITGRVTQRQSDYAQKSIQGDVLTTALRYEGLERVIAGVFGTAGVPATVDTTARRHVFKIADNLGVWFTLAYEIIKDTTIYEFNQIKLSGLTLRIQANGRLEISVRGIAHDFTDTSVINTTTTIDTVTLPANREYAEFRSVVVRMNAQSAGALGAPDVRFVTGLEINIDRNLQPDFTTEFGDKTSEPQPASGGDPFFKVNGSITFSQLDTASPGGNSGLVATQLAGTTQKMDINITADTLAGAATQKFAHVLWLPCLQFGDGKPSLTAGALGWQVPFTAYHVLTIPTGFTAGYIDAVTWENYSQIATDALA